MQPFHYYDTIEIQTNGKATDKLSFRYQWSPQLGEEWHADQIYNRGLHDKCSPVHYTPEC